MPAEKMPTSLSFSRQNEYYVSPEPAIYRINLTAVRLCEIARVQLRPGKMLLPKRVSLQAGRCTADLHHPEEFGLLFQE